MRQAHARSGLWPVFANPSDFDDERPWEAGEVSPQPVADIGRVGVGDLLAACWKAWIAGEHHLWVGNWPPSAEPLELASGFTVSRDDGFAGLAPFGRDWPGLAPAGDGQDPDAFADRYVRDNDHGTSRIMLVPAVRGADVPTAAGWDGAVNYIQPKSPLSSVLRSWEERFGTRLIEVGFDTLHLSVAAPPVARESAERVAAEHFGRSGACPKAHSGS